MSVIKVSVTNQFIETHMLFLRKAKAKNSIHSLKIR